LPPTTVVLLKGYPRLSETFIAQEILGLERAGLPLILVALRRPTDSNRHPVHDEIKAPVSYLPEYLHDEPGRVLRGLFRALAYPGFFRTLAAFLHDLRHDRSRNRVRRFGQALVLAAEWPKGAGWLHAHFIHTPASVARYASLILRVPWTCSAHAKDIWTSPDWDLRQKLEEARWTVTCTRNGFDRLRELARRPERVHLCYHGLDLDRFAPSAAKRSSRNGRKRADPVIILSVGRAVDKKGYDILLRALALLKPSFRFVHAGGGEQLAKLTALAASQGLDGVVEWRGALAQEDVLALYRQADIFALACRISADGDRDGLPNVLVEAASQGLACVATAVSGVPELFTHDIDGLLVEPENPRNFADALARLIGDPSLRERLGRAAEKRVREHFDHRAGIAKLVELFEAEWRRQP
jgi:glycosyltransferase involved in cell wall biosynthesis